MKSRRIVRMRKHRKSRKGGGIFTTKTMEDNRRNCVAYYKSTNPGRVDICKDDKELKLRSYPGMMNRMMGNKEGSKLGTSMLGF
jgi:hypothetical protein